MSLTSPLTKDQQLFTITMEECSELAQACSKMLRFSENTDRDRLVEEAGDVLCMLELLEEWGYFSRKELENRVQYKREKLQKWSDIIE